jgi:toxin FitB
MIVHKVPFHCQHMAAHSREETKKKNMEVYKKIKKERTEEEALLAVSLMKKTSLVPLEESIAFLAADLSLKYALPMADAMVYATAVEKNADLITSDSHFKGIEKVILIL